MSNEQHIGSDKSRYVSTPKRTEIRHTSGLGSLKTNAPAKRSFNLNAGEKVDATFVLVPAANVQATTVVHPLNPRNQEALNPGAVRDILEQIEARGVDTEGIAVKHNDVYLIIEGSRRRYCCIQANKDLPLWVLPETITDDNIRSIIAATQTSRKFSYREVGLQYLKIMQERNFTTNEELAAYLGITHVSVSKRTQAAHIDYSLIELFPDCEAIPNSYYAKLSKFQKYIEKNKFFLDDVVSKVKAELSQADELDIDDAQRFVMDRIQLAVNNLDDKSSKNTWTTYDLAKFENKDKYARISTNKSGRKVKMEFNRISADSMKKIEDFIKSVLINN
ncbi:ParB N-terminal domain-containing protein [Enterobacter asburiae]|nr:ParB N-terminal domain-containing protein [Enterobacter asburiae]